MRIRPIRNDNDLRAALRRLDAVFQAGAGTLEADEMEVLVTLIEAYENKHYPIGPPDPIDAIKFRMEQQGLTARDLEAHLGPSGRVSELLNRKRPLSPRMKKACMTDFAFPTRACSPALRERLSIRGRRRQPRLRETHPRINSAARCTDLTMLT